MSVEVSFQPTGLSGLIPEGTYLIDAARRMGLRLPVDCRERGECTSCVVMIVSGQSLLSQPTNAEREMLSEERLAMGQRLACQTRIESAGEVMVQVIPREEEAGSKEDKGRAQMEETLAVMKKFDDFVDKSLAAGEKVLDRFADRIRSAREQDLAKKRPPEHRT